MEKRSKGLGDSLEKFFHTLKLDYLAYKVTKALGKEDCGCTRRRDKLNKWFPYSKLFSFFRKSK